MLIRLSSQLLAFLLWILHFLPLPILALLGKLLGGVLYVTGRRRRQIAATNLEMCFPELSESQRNRLVLQHFQTLGRSLLERSILWWGSPERLRRLIRIEGEDIIHASINAGRPVILLAPHFVGLDAGGIAIAQRFDVVSIYARQSNEVFDQLLLAGRSRFGNQLLLSRQDGVRATVKAMKSGRPFYYLPDLNARRRDAVFAPFFGVPASTTTGLSRLARAADAVVIPCVTRMLPGGEGYWVEISPPWPDYPTSNPEADTAVMNQWLEGIVRTMPEQYYWVHRRFKTRPAGAPKIY